MSAANDLLAQHIIERMLADVEVLEQVGALETHSASTIRSQLHPLLSDEGSAVASTAAAVSALSISAAAQKREAPPRPTSAASTPTDFAKALWAYPGEDSDELSFGVNDTIVVTERTSSDWWKGHVQGIPAVVGLFPSNYVEFKGIGNKVGDSAVRGFGFGLGAGMAGKIL
ncbi:unconventional myosin-if [Ceraceosorus bombacis]|uniref:Unconventional myosin-if n=1 Tax=Ceraceosorus bombacis TaxID=401625 RepID=A0A0N7LBE5_9BASI|nr:unconventional myosin-if [Ceraceosorus bombacis]